MAILLDPFVVELRENHTPMDLINRGAPSGMSELKGDETNYRQESFTARGGELVHLVAYRPLGVDDKSMHRCDCLTERSLGA